MEIPLLVSVIITTKNEERNLGRLLASIQKETYQDYEIIVVDNGSADQTKAIARKYTELVFDKGPERSAQRNFGVERAIGQFVLILDADMELEPRVLTECVSTMQQTESKALVIPERSVGQGFWAQCKAFERSFYVGDESIEAARFFDRKVFLEFGGYDTAITGPEDFDLPWRIRQKHGDSAIGRIASFIIHHEGHPTLWRLMKKKFYYGQHAKAYFDKHPQLRLTQGNLLFRPAFFRGWKRLLQQPVLAICMFFMRACEMLAAGSGFIVGLVSHSFDSTRSTVI